MRKRTGLAAVLAASLMLLVGASSASAGPNKSFDATFCFATSYEGVSPALVATVTWSGYRVNNVSIGIGDGSGAGFGVFFPVTAARSGLPHQSNRMVVLPPEPPSEPHAATEPSMTPSASAITALTAVCLPLRMPSPPNT